MAKKDSNNNSNSNSDTNKKRYHKEILWTPKDNPMPKSQGESIKESNTTSERGSGTVIKKGKEDS